MRHEQITCDRCKKKMSKDIDSYYELKITWRETTDNPRERDLCEECLRDLMTFIDSPKSKGRVNDMKNPIKILHEEITQLREEKAALLTACQRAVSAMEESGNELLRNAMFAIDKIIVEAGGKSATRRGRTRDENT